MKARKITSLLLVLTMLSLGSFLVLPEGKGAGTRAGGAEVGKTLWDAEIAFQGTGAIDGVALGDADTSRAGNELVWASRDQKVYMGYYNDAGVFSYDDIWTSGGQQLTPAIGNLRADLPGNEILVVGLSSGTEDVDPGDGTATMLSKSGAGWTANRAFTDEKLIHGCDIGDIDPTIPGEEAVVVTFSFKAYMIWWDNGAWNSSFIFQDTNNVRKVYIADLLPDSIHPGNELVAVSKSGNLTIAYGSKDGWTVDVIYSDPAEPFARVCIGDLDPSVPGLEIFGGTDTSKVLGFKRDGTKWTKQEIFVDTDKNRGVWVGDVDPLIPGNELYSFGYSTRLVQITGSFASGWNTRVLWNDVARGHELRVGEIDPTNEYNEIALVGYSNNVSIISPSGWKVSVPFQGTGALDGVTVGDADTARAGNELVWASRDQKVYLGYYDDAGAFSYDDIWTSGGQQLTPAIGNLRDDLPGNEILVVGLSSGTEDVDPGDGTATVLSKSGSGWTADLAFSEPKLIHGCDIGDIDPTIPGEEAIVVTFSFKAYMIWWDNGEWNSSFIFQDTNNVRKVYIVDVLPDSIHPGNELVAVSKSGNLTIAYGSKDGWTVDVIYSNPAEPFARVCIGDVDPDVPGLEIFGGTDTSKVLGFKRQGSDWTMQEVFVDTDKNRGVWVGDVDPEIPGNELYSFGYSAKLVQITGSFASGWKTKVIWSDVARGHELRVADFHPDDGLEIACVGYSNNVSVISLMDAVGAMAPTITDDGTDTIDSGEVKEIKLNIESFSKMYFSVADVEGLVVEVMPTSMFSSGTLTLKVKAEGTSEDKTATINLQIDYGSGKLTYPLDLSIVKDTVAPTVDLLKDAEGNEIGVDDQILWNDTLTIQFSEPISEASFNAAKTAGTLKLEWGGKAREEAVFVLSEDRKSISVDLEPLKLAGTVTITLEGLKDDAGLDIDQTPLEVKVKGEMSDENGIAWIVIIIVLVIILIGAAVVYFAFIGKKESSEGELPPEPKQI